MNITQLHTKYILNLNASSFNALHAASKLLIFLSNPGLTSVHDVFTTAILPQKHIAIKDESKAQERKEREE
ncbi:hypothetical protein L1887_20027 [Cichorium endivia]|nr:hypothetical protein L1887_20027 [Cichorium endivia]